MPAVRWFLLGVFAVAIGLALVVQREATANLRSEIALLRAEQRELGELRSERDRLKAAQPPAAEMERLRADRAALEHLRAEIEKMKENVGRAEANVATASGGPALTLGLNVGSDGKLTSEGSPLDLNVLRPRLSRLAKGALVEFRIMLDPKSRSDDAKAAVDSLVQLEKELGLKFNLRFEQGTLTAR